MGPAAARAGAAGASGLCLGEKQALGRGPGPTALSFLTVAERGMGELTSRPWPPVGSRILSGRKIRGAGALGCGVGLPPQPWARPPRYFVRDLGILCVWGFKQWKHGCDFSDVGAIPAPTSPPHTHTPSLCQVPWVFCETALTLDLAVPALGTDASWIESLGRQDKLRFSGGSVTF